MSKSLPQFFALGRRKPIRLTKAISKRFVIFSLSFFPLTLILPGHRRRSLRLAVSLGCFFLKSPIV